MEVPPTPEPNPGAEASPGHAPASGPAWRIHDFQRPRPLNRREIGALDTLHAKFARNLSDVLSVLVRSRIHVELLAVGQKTYFDFIRSLPNPTCLHLVYSYPQRAPLVLELGLPALYPMIERILGGKGDCLRQPVRPLTRIEQKLAASLAEKVLGSLVEVWAQGPDFRLDIAEAEHNPLLLQIVGPSEPTLVLGFEIALGIRTGSLHLALPLKPFEECIARLIQAAMPGGREERNTEGERDRILRRISGSGVTLVAELPPVPIRLQDLVTLRPGDMIDTQVHRGTDVPVSVEGHRIFRGQTGSQDGRRVVKIVRAEGD